MDSFELKTRLSVNMKKLRKNKQWSQFELAEQADISEQTVNSIESKRLWPSDKTLIKIINALDADIYQLFLPDTDEKIFQPATQNDLREAVIQSVRDLVESTLKYYTD